MRGRGFLKTIIIWVAVVAVLSFFLRPRPSVSAEALDGAIAITGKSGYTFTVQYEDITDIRYSADYDYGTCIEGTDSDAEMSGSWQNAELGEYNLCVDPDIGCCVIAWTGSGTYVFNYESESATEGLFEAIEKVMP